MGELSTLIFFIFIFSANKRQTGGQVTHIACIYSASICSCCYRVSP